MASNTIYNLAFTPGVANGAVVANYTLNFGTYNPWVFWNRGSNNGVDAEGLSLYINNKQNNNIVSVNADNGQYIRDIPPYGEAVLPISGRQVVTISCNGGVCPVEFHNRPAEERIFQRTDSASQIAQFSSTLGTAFGDLVTIDRIGRIQPANAQPFASNNTTTDFPGDTAWPAPPTHQGFTASHYAIQDSAGRLVSVDNATGAQLGIWISNNVGANIASNLSTAAACVPCPIYEGPGWYYTAWQNQAFFGLHSKTTGAVVYGVSPAFATGYMVGCPKANGASLDYWIAAIPATNVAFANVVNNVVQGYATCATGMGGTFNTNTDTMHMRPWGDTNVLVSFFDSATTAFRVLVCDPLSNGAAAFSLATTASANTGFKNRNWIDVEVSSSGYGFLPFRSAATGNAHLVTISPAGVITNNNLGSVGSVVFGGITDDGGYIVCWHNAGLVLQVRKFDSTGALVVNTSYTLPAGTWNGIARLYTDADSWVHVLMFNNAGLRAIVIDSAAGALIPVASSVAIGAAAAAASYPIFATSRGFATHTVGTQPVPVLGDLAKSVFGVDRGDGAILIQGVASINQFFAGSNTFNQNAATVVGNRGIVVNSTAQLNGLT